MTSSNPEPVAAPETPDTPEPAAPDTPIGNLTVEDDPQGTVDPSDLAGTASDDDADVS